MAELSDQSMIQQETDRNNSFTASGTYTSPGFGPGQADYLVVAGGGGGGMLMVVVEVEQADIELHFLVEQN
jgi:hypothetical protein